MVAFNVEPIYTEKAECLSGFTQCQKNVEKIFKKAHVQ